MFVHASAALRISARLYLILCSMTAVYAANPPPDVVKEAAMARVYLRDGGEIQGTLLLQDAERVIIDLGVQVLTLPRAAVQRIADHVINDNATSEPQNIQHALYQIARTPVELSVSDNLGRCAEAVLRVKTPLGLGSGFLVHAEGYVITNHHVIDGEYDITLTLYEQTPSELRPIVFNKVRIVALDARLDLALLKIEDLGEHRLKTVPLGNSNLLKQGDTVFSIGSPLGFDRTVSQGIISLKNRPMDSQLYLQTTTQINPGNSGGPLFNLRGEVIGVNNMKIGSIGIEGLSFAIPANTLQSFLDNADAYAFDTSNPNNGFRYNRPPAIPGEE